MRMTAMLRRVVPGWAAALLLLMLALMPTVEARPAGAALRVVGDENYPPYLFLNAEGQPEGFVVDVWKLWERKTGLRVELRALKWEDAQRALLQGDADVIENIYRTPGREPLYDFSAPYAELPVAIYRDVSIGGITGLSGLRGFQVGVMKGDACIETLQRGGVANLTYYDNYTQLIQGAMAQEVKVFCLDEHPADFYLYRLGAHRRFVKAFELYRGEFHRAVRKGNAEVLRQVEQGMAAISDEEMDRLRDKWLGTPTDLRGYVVPAAWALAVALLGAGLLAIWIVTLRRSVAARTAELVRSDRALREREAQLRSLGDNLPGGFIYQYEIADGVPRFRYVSAGITPLLGFAPEAVTGDARPLFAQVPPGALAAYAEAEAKSAREMTDFSVTMPFELADGRRRWVQIQSRPRQTPEGTVVWDGVTLDVTDRIASREELERRVEARTAELAVATHAAQRTSERLRAILDGATSGILLIRNRMIEQCNRRLEAMTGHEAGELDGKPTEILYADHAAWRAAGPEIRETLSSGRPYVREQLARRKDGSTFWVRISASAIDPADFDKGVVGMMEDITQEREVREAMDRARALAEEAARIKSEFMANMSHEIRTPMNSIIGMSLLALKAGPEPRIRDYLEKIQSSSRHLLGVINDILDFSKLEADRMVLEDTEFGLDETLDELRNVFSQKAAEKGLEFVIDPRAGVPASLVGDPLRINQILINLVGNAVKFTEQGEVVLRITVAQREGDRAVLRFEVQDSGIGMSADEVEHLFESFRQADASTTRRFGGTGLGLAISKRLVALMGGHIGVDSAPGRGSTFWFTLPLGVGHRTDAGTVARPVFRDMRALVVDDNDSAREVIVEMLRTLGFDVSGASAGPAALEAVAAADREGSPFGLVFLDWKMPGMDGLETARALSSMTLTCPPRVLMITAFDRDEVLPAARALGIGEVLVKPVTPSALFDAVMRRFGVGGTHAEPAAADVLVQTRALAGARALLVEDNALNQQVATEFLNAIGLEVDLANNGRTAIDLLERRPYDVVLMDMQMPVMDGLEATREIRRRPQFASLPILAMTANAMPGDRERCLAAGMNDHIAKPIDPEDLVAKLQRWVHAGRSPPTAVDAKPVSSAAAGLPAEASLEAIYDCLHAVEHLDVDVGLRQSAGRPSLYLSLLRKYVEGQREAARSIGEAIAGGRWQDAERVAHTLKGVSAQIGAMHIADQARALEQMLRERSEPHRSAEPLRRLEATLATLIGSIDRCLVSIADTAPARVHDAAQWAELREQLLTLLADDDAGSVELANAHRDLLQGALGPGYPSFMQAIRNFDFPQALQLLRAGP